MPLSKERMRQRKQTDRLSNLNSDSKPSRMSNLVKPNYSDNAEDWSGLAMSNLSQPPNCPDGRNVDADGNIIYEGW